ncbi:MAG: acyl--CoA ligase, partial [Hyphomicrobiales bacterium]|nr:acyl--CoA ligase [Hyphomicrobiales bacterium]
MSGGCADSFPAWPDFERIADRIHATATEAPERVAVIDGERSLTYREFDAAIDRVAAALQRDGVGPRETIAICAASSFEYVATFFGALRAGVVVAPLAPSATAQSLAEMTRDCAARLVFLDATTEAALAEVDAAVARISLDGEAKGAGIADWLAPPGARPTAVEVAPDWVFNTIYSSGTTGSPKGIDQSHVMRWGHMRRARQFDYGPQSVTLLSTPLYSNTTLVSLIPALGMGGAVALMRRFEAHAFLALAERVRATHAMLVPVQYRRIMALPDFDAFDLSSFAMKFSTSAPFPADLKRDVLQRWPGGLVELYGMTEGGGSCILPAHLFPDKLNTVGRPAEGHEIKLIDEDGREAAPGEAGEIVGRSGAMMNGYRNRPDKTREAEWFDAAGARFIRTGDVGRFDEDGFLVLIDRRKDMIISGGFNVYPSDIEAVLAERPEIAEAAVVGVPSAEWGETPVAFVALKDGAALDAEALRTWANARLGKTQRLA